MQNKCVNEVFCQMPQKYFYRTKKRIGDVPILVGKFIADGFIQRARGARCG